MAYHTFPWVIRHLPVHQRDELFKAMLDFHDYDKEAWEKASGEGHGEIIDIDMDAVAESQARAKVGSVMAKEG